MNKEEIQKIVNEAINIKLDSLRFSSQNQTPYHEHSGNDGTPQIDPINLKPYTTYSAIPTDLAPNGIFKLVFDGANYRLYYRINNLWKYVTLT